MTEVETKTKKLKPARKQVPEDFQLNRTEQQSGQVYNIWYNKWAGGDTIDPYANKTKAQTRLNLKKDTGYTRADRSNQPYICLFWARGCCPYGSECNFLHRRPLPSDNFDYSKDIFGRSKHDGYRDDMGGVGSFSRINRTLYIGRINANEHIDKIVNDHFKEFGKIEKIKILIARGVAFVTYYSDRDAELAKEAMMNQSMEHDEILNVRWATEDPNEGIRAAEALRVKALGIDTVAQNMPKAFRDAILSVDELEAQEGTQDDADDDQRAAKRPRLTNGESSKPATVVEMTADDIDWQLQAIQEEQAHLRQEEIDYKAEEEKQRLEQEEYIRQQKQSALLSNGANATVTAGSSSTKTSSFHGVVDYGSDSD